MWVCLRWLIHTCTQRDRKAWKFSVLTSKYAYMCSTVQHLSISLSGWSPDGCIVIHVVYAISILECYDFETLELFMLLNMTLWYTLFTLSLSLSLSSPHSQRNHWYCPLPGLHRLVQLLCLKTVCQCSSYGLNAAADCLSLCTLIWPFCTAHSFLDKKNFIP